MLPRFRIGESVPIRSAAVDPQIRPLPNSFVVVQRDEEVLLRSSGPADDSLRSLFSHVLPAVIDGDNDVGVGTFATTTHDWKGIGK